VIYHSEGNKRQSVNSIGLQYSLERGERERNKDKRFTCQVTDSLSLVYTEICNAQEEGRG
jgi:hypothetical protein